MVEVTRLRFEHHERDVIGIGAARPRISWSIMGTGQDWTQKSYQLEVTFPDVSVAQDPVNSSLSCLVPWPWRPLMSRERAVVRVRVIGNSDNEYSPWSSAVIVEAGLLNVNDWKASLIEPVEHSNTLRPVVFGKRFRTNGVVRLARLYITAHGIYEATLNGSRIGDHVLAPGWTSYHHRLLYQTYNITQHFASSDEYDVQITVAEGWYKGRLGFNGGRSGIYGDCIGLLAMIVLEYQDGTSASWGSDSSWEWTYGCHLSASLYDGKSFDAREEISTETQWHTVAEKPNPTAIVAPDGPPIRRTQELAAVSVGRTASGKFIIDFGQNLAGFVRFEIETQVTCTIRLLHGEVLEGGELCRRPLRSCEAIDTVVAPPGKLTKYEPKFTFHGFRYVQVEGWPNEPDLKAFTAVSINSDMERTGHFSCSSSLLNRLHQNIVWSMRSNFLSIPTDCPQRDERLGWTGDIYVFSLTGSFLYDTSGFLMSWLKDVAAEQQQSGGIVPLTVPNVIPGLAKEPHAIWGDTIVMLPWSLYKYFGDKNVLATHFRDMQLWLLAITRDENGLWDYCSDWKLADWLDPEAPPDDPGLAKTDPLLVSNAFLVHTVSLMVSIAGVLGEDKDEARYTAEHARLHKAFQEEYMTPSGRLATDTQTAYALAVYFSLYTSPEQESTAVKRLEWLVRRVSRFRIATGFAGTPYLGHAMTKLGLSNIFYRMLLERKSPSWLYPVTMGATTVWERWDSMLPSSEINPGEMTSFNHYALGSVADWMHSVILGLKPIEPGWSTFAIEPVPGGPLTWAQGSYQSAYGDCEVRWESVKSNDGRNATFWMQIRVPPNTRARITLPGQADSKWVGSGAYELKSQYIPDKWPPRAIYARNMDETDDLLADEDHWSR